VTVDNTNPIFQDLTSADNNTKNIEVTLILNNAEGAENPERQMKKCSSGRRED